MKLRNMTKGKIVKGSGLAVMVAPPLVTTLIQFPVWVERDAESTVSGIAILLAAVCVLPFLKLIGEYLRSPAVPVVWGIIFAVMLAIRAIIDEMLWVSGVGLLSSFGGMALWKTGGRMMLNACKEATDGTDTDE